jgi:hypothetical protein
MTDPTSRTRHVLAVIITVAAALAGCGGQAPAPAASTAAATVASTGPDATTRSLEGIYRWTLTDEDALAHGTPNDQTKTALDTGFPCTFTVTLRAGTWSMEQTTDSDIYGGTYQATAEQLTFNWPAEHSVLLFTFAVADGKITLRPVEPMDAGDRFVWSTRPWTKIS